MGKLMTFKEVKELSRNKKIAQSQTKSEFQEIADLFVEIQVNVKKGIKKHHFLFFKAVLVNLTGAVLKKTAKTA